MEHFVWGRDRPGAAERRAQVTEAHWAFMDRYADAMIARGPTLTDDGTQVTGSVHLVDLPDAAAARAFADGDPYHVAGVFADVTVRRWRNALGRTMWEFPGEPAASPRFLVVAHGAPGSAERRDALIGEHLAYLDSERYRRCFVARGPLLDDAGVAWQGSVRLVELPERAAVEAFVAGDPFARGGMYASVEVHRWRPGGRPA